MPNVITFLKFVGKVALAVVVTKVVLSYMPQAVQDFFNNPPGTKQTG